MWLCIWLWLQRYLRELVFFPLKHGYPLPELRLRIYFLQTGLTFLASLWTILVCVLVIWTSCALLPAMISAAPIYSFSALELMMSRKQKFKKAYMAGLDSISTTESLKKLLMRKLTLKQTAQWGWPVCLQGGKTVACFLVNFSFLLQMSLLTQKEMVWKGLKCEWALAEFEFPELNLRVSKPFYPFPVPVVA